MCVSNVNHSRFTEGRKEPSPSILPRPLDLSIGWIFKIFLRPHCAIEYANQKRPIMTMKVKNIISPAIINMINGETITNSD